VTYLFLLLGERGRGKGEGGKGKGERGKGKGKRQGGKVINIVISISV